jgi:cell division protein FtsI (penicillin-binding protein 3)
MSQIRTATGSVQSPFRSSSRRTNKLLEVNLKPMRSRVVFLILSLAFLALVCRAVWVQVFSQEFLQGEADARFMQTQKLQATRGKILDRNGSVLASSLPAKAIAVFPGSFDADRTQMTELARLLKLPVLELQRKIHSVKHYHYLQRQVDPVIADKIAKLGITGLDIQREYKRQYPGGEASAQVVGYTNSDDQGLEGVEFAFQKVLAGQAGHRRVMRNRLGHMIDEDSSALLPPMSGRDVELAIDTRIQDLAFMAVKDAVFTQRAKAGAAVVIDVQTGEVLALANWPTYNPDKQKNARSANQRNRILTDVFEPGSTMKPFTVALALEQGKVKPSTVIQTAPGRLTFGPATIRDAHVHGALTVEQVIQKSSNVGTARIATEMLSRETTWGFLTQLGFGQAPQIGFPGAASGRLRPYKNWRPIEQATMSYGHGISSSLMQMARAYTVFATDGQLLPLTITKVQGAPEGQRVLKPETAMAMRKMLEMASGPDGTAPLAQTIGYRVAGKTGTTHKLENGQYVNKYVSSFVGFAPASAPRVIVAVMLDEPNAGKYYAGDVAAPIFARITSDVLHLLRVQPDAPFRTEIEKPTVAVMESL